MKQESAKESVWAALHEKVPNGLSLCHTKRKMGAGGLECFILHSSYGPNGS